jgi:hypothetical protein
MEFILLSEKQKLEYSQKVFEMLEKSDKEFVPPLSSRASTTQKDLSGKGGGNGIGAYFDTMIKQKLLGFFDGGEFCGVLSFIEDYESEEIKGMVKPNIYLSTLVLSPLCRGKGATKKAYDYLFNTLYPTHAVYTRTWSTNIAHIKILDYFNFTHALVKPNDRGEGIDTIYFYKGAND